MSNAKKSTFILLPAKTNVYDVADLSRAAVMEFLSGTGSGWTRRALALWLAGSYSRATARVGAPTRTTRRTLVPVSQLSDDIGIERLLLSTRESLIEMAETLVSGGTSEEIAREMLAAGHLVGIRDDLGAVGYAPIAGPELRLVDRVSALLVADYLTRPSDYRSLRVCGECAQVFFEWAPQHHQRCDEDPRESGIVPKRSEELLVTFEKARGG